MDIKARKATDKIAEQAFNIYLAGTDNASKKSRLSPDRRSR